MTLSIITFYVFASVAVASGLLVVLARDPVHSVAWMILTFFSSAGLMVLMGAEFVAMVLIIVYGGAVLVLMLFVIMMLEADLAELKGNLAENLPLGALIGLVLIVELGLVAANWAVPESARAARGAETPLITDTANTTALGLILYDDHILAFQLAGLILLVALVGVIVLTLRQRQDTKNQGGAGQVYSARGIDLKDFKPGRGI
ncbi:MAG: NADH-quinone oxidoreductase subunit J [Pseudomonadota bacterium]